MTPADRHFCTFSIVARCERTGQFGAAIASATPAVGAFCVWMRAGIGAVCTQSWTNPHLGIQAIERMAKGLSAGEAGKAVLATDTGAERRQLGIVGAVGQGFAWSGQSCTACYGHKCGATYSVQGNMLVGEEVIHAMSERFASSPSSLSLDERLLSALEAGQNAGGDKRGQQSAALAIVSDRPWRSLDLRVDEHVTPISELRRIHTLALQQLLPFERALPDEDGSCVEMSEQDRRMILQAPSDRSNDR